MRALLAVILLSLPTVALADDNSWCREIREESRGRISCSFIGGTYLLDYRDSITYRFTQWSGQHGDMLRFLCENGEIVTETLKGRMKRVHRCP